MKTIITIVTAIMICALMIFSVQAEMKQPLKAGIASQAMVPVTITFTGCPPGFTPTGNQSDPGLFQCVKNKPATPCAQGYTVKWGPCPASEPFCSYSCSATAPPAGAANNFKNAICATKSGYNLDSSPCIIKCTAPPR